MTEEQAKQSIANDERALANSIKFLNEMGSLKMPGGKSNPIPTDPALERVVNLPTPQATVALQPASSPVTSEPAHSLGSKIFFTGRLCAGKDYAAGKLEGAKILGFADPIYTLAAFLFNVQVTATNGKDIPGMRKFLQTLGQWGRNEINAQYPVTPERAMFCQMIRSYAAQKIVQLEGVDLESFGLDRDIWLDCLINRAENYLNTRAVGRVIATNCRFANEYTKLETAGFQHWHVICSPQTLIKRLAARGLNPNSPEVSDMSEQMANSLDKQVAAKLATPGGKLQVIWSDEATPPPSGRLYTVEQFTKLPNAQ